MMAMAESGRPAIAGRSRACDSCNSALCTTFPHANSAFFCSTCNARARPSRHGPVRMCEVCGRSPAAFSCEADSAVLCGPCDAMVHSVNPLARRHRRVPILPVPEASTADFASLRHGVELEDEDAEEDDDEEEGVDSWLLLDPPGNGTPSLVIDEFLDLGRFVENPTQEKTPGKGEVGHRRGSDHVVPAVLARSRESNCEDVLPQVFDFGIEYEHVKEEEIFDCANPFLSHSFHVPVSGVDQGIVVAGIPCPGSGLLNEMTDIFSGSQSCQLPVQVAPLMDREARVLRYREKRKMRKFEKTIRYASRKAYAEVRPRIKGRFAKRSEVEADAAAYAEADYGIVPSY